MGLPQSLIGGGVAKVRDTDGRQSVKEQLWRGFCAANSDLRRRDRSSRLIKLSG
jgi:hypothetical protein